MSGSPRIIRWLEHLRGIRPPSGAVIVGAGAGRGPWTTFLRDAGVSKVVAVEADPMRFRHLERSMPAGWVPLCEVVGPTEGSVTFHQASLRSESGLIEPGLLAPLWQGIRSIGSDSRHSLTLSHLRDIHDIEPGWLFIDCLPAASVLTGLAGFADDVDVLVARALVTRHKELEACGLEHLQSCMETLGFGMIAAELSRHPSFVHGLFVRSGVLASADQLAGFPETARLLSGELGSVEKNAETLPWVRNHLTILRSELNLMQVELSLALARGQLAAGDGPVADPPQSLEEAERCWLDQLARKAKSQLQQDLWVLKMTSYKRGGFFVEFGATDGVLLSNTHLLEKEFGWRGICAEPNPESFKALSRNRLCTVSPACIGPVTGEEVEFIFAEAYGGMTRDLASDNHQEKREAYQQTGHTAVLTTISLHDFLLEHHAPKTIDYLSIDTEGSEFSILEKFPFDQWDVRLLTVEHNFTEQRESIRGLLEGFGYVRIEAEWDDWYYKQP